MYKQLKKINLLGMAVMMLVLISSCSSDDDYSNNQNDPANENEEVALRIQVINNETLGTILVTQNNQSLYFFAGDVTGKSNCNGGCAEVWPPFIADLSELEIASGLNSADLGTFTREDGKQQITFKGWPLYYFSPEADGVLEAPGQTLGDARGGVFSIAKPNYTVLIAQQSIAEGEEPLRYLVDANGVSLYHFINDGLNESNCNGGCAEIWPPFQVHFNIVLPSTLEVVLPTVLSRNDFSVANRNDELGPQLTFKGSPLYHFSQDEGIRGSILGQGGAGGTFFITQVAGVVQ